MDSRFRKLIADKAFTILSGETIDYTKFLKVMIEGGELIDADNKHENKKDKESLTDAPSSDSPIPTSAQKKRFAEAYTVFKSVWQATEFNVMQRDEIKFTNKHTLKPQLEIGSYHVKQDCGYAIHNQELNFKIHKPKTEEDKKNESVKTLEKNQSYILAANQITSPIKAGSHFYFRNGKKLFYVTNSTSLGDMVFQYIGEMGEEDTKSLEEIIESKTESSDNSTVVSADLSTDQLLRMTQLDVSKKANHTHIKDESQYQAKFHLKFSHQKQVDMSLKLMEAYYSSIIKEIEDENIQEEKDLQQRVEDLHDQAHNAISGYLTWGQYFLKKLGTLSGLVMSITFGGIEGGTGVFHICKEILKLPIMWIWQGVALLYGGANSIIQYKTFGKDTGQQLVDLYGKDKWYEGYTVHHNATGKHELSDKQKKFLGVTGVGAFITGIVVGALTYFGVKELPLLLSIGATVAFPPAAILAIMIAELIFITINIMHLNMGAYARFLQSGKTFKEWITDPFYELKKKLTDEKVSGVKKGLIGIIYVSMVLLGCFGLAANIVSGQVSIDTVIDKFFDPRKSLEYSLAITTWAAAVISGLSRLMFTIQRAMKATVVVFNNDYKVSKKDKALIALSGIETGGYIALTSNPGWGAVAGVREAQAEISGTAEESDSQFPSCGIYTQSDIPTLDNWGKDKAKAAYVFINSGQKGWKLYYINTVKGESQDLGLSSDKVLGLYNKMNHFYKKFNQDDLGSEDLEKINKFVRAHSSTHNKGHKHVENYVEEVRNARIRGLMENSIFKKKPQRSDGLELEVKALHKVTLS